MSRPRSTSGEPERETSASGPSKSPNPSPPQRESLPGVQQEDPEAPLATGGDPPAKPTTPPNPNPGERTPWPEEATPALDPLAETMRHAVSVLLIARSTPERGRPRIALLHRRGLWVLPRLWIEPGEDPTQMARAALASQVHPALRSAPVEFLVTLDGPAFGSSPHRPSQPDRASAHPTVRTQYWRAYTPDIQSGGDPAVEWWPLEQAASCLSLAEERLLLAGMQDPLAHPPTSASERARDAGPASRPAGEAKRAQAPPRPSPPTPGSPSPLPPSPPPPFAPSPVARPRCLLGHRVTGRFALGFPAPRSRVP